MVLRYPLTSAAKKKDDVYNCFEEAVSQILKEGHLKPVGDLKPHKDEPINVLQFCHLTKHCSEVTCVDYKEFSPEIMRQGLKSGYTKGRLMTEPNQEGPTSAHLMTSLWSPWKSEQGTIDLIKKLYPTWQGGEEGTLNNHNFNVYQVDDPNENLPRNEPPEGTKADYIFFIYCPFNGTLEETNAVLSHAKRYIKPGTKCFATWSEGGGRQPLERF